MEELICPHCRGNKYTMIADNTFLCAYCGATFQGPNFPEQHTQQPQQPQQQPIIQYVYQEAPKQAKTPKRNKGCCAWILFVFILLYFYFKFAY